MDSLLEILPFLSPDARLDLKSLSVTNILSLTGSEDSRKLLYKCPEVIKALISLTQDSAETIAKDSVLAVLNISADYDGAVLLLEIVPNLIGISVQYIKDVNCPLADPWAMVLSNVSRPEQLVERVLDALEECSTGEISVIDEMVTCFTRIDYNSKKCNLNYLGPIFSNLSQSPRGRKIFCNPDRDIFQRLLPFVHHDGSIVRKGGTIGLLKNLCFDSTRHDWLLHEMKVLPYILLPLAGPEELSDEENDMLPPELQYLGTDKTREADPDLRKILLESLAQLCATRTARDYLRKMGTYEILRELHKWECTEEGDPNVLLACENVVDILIRTEDEIGEDNLKTLEIPNDVLDKINNMESITQ